MDMLHKKKNRTRSIGGSSCRYNSMCQNDDKIYASQRKQQQDRRQCRHAERRRRRCSSDKDKKNVNKGEQK